MNEMTSLFYPVAMVICVFMVYSNYSKMQKYKKANMEVLYVLEQDGKTIRTISSTFLIFIILTSVITIYDTVSKTGLSSAETVSVVFLPIMFIVLYIPLSQKTKITTLGILRLLILIRWEDIRGIDYLKADSKGKQKVKIAYRISNRDAVIELLFHEKDAELELFKQSAKEYRNKKNKK